jgi:chromosome segregation protein
MERRVAQTARETERTNLEKSLERLRRFQAEGAERLESIGRDIEEREARKEAALKTVAETEAGLAALRTALEEAAAAVRDAETELAAAERELAETGAVLESVRARREAAGAEARSLSVDLQGLEMRRENVENRILERYHRALAAFSEEIDGLAGAELTPEAMAQELERLRGKLERLGDVNLSAISEYEALKEREEFLESQRADLAEAVADLHKVIRKINRVSQERFLETFNQVNEKLKEVFPKLFEGGDARLELTEPNQPLESGVEFLVSPPGKRLTRMTLLSGGEKAMSAIAFVFSIFLIKPAAFCILDEIDAPLDEANVYRFNKLLKLIGEKSQIIMITHKRRSMEFADILFGVTMEKKGISRVVSVDLEESRAMAEDDEAVQADGGEAAPDRRSAGDDGEGSPAAEMEGESVPEDAGGEDASPGKPEE